MSSIVVKPGQSAVGRTAVLIIMMIDAALGQLRDLGYERGFDDVEIVEDEGFPYITLNNEILFRVFFDADPDRGLSIKGDWKTTLPPKKRFLWALRAYRWIIKRISGDRVP